MRCTSRSDHSRRCVRFAFPVFAHSGVTCAQLRFPPSRTRWSPWARKNPGRRGAWDTWSPDPPAYVRSILRLSFHTPLLCLVRLPPDVTARTHSYISHIAPLREVSLFEEPSTHNSDAISPSALCSPLRSHLRLRPRCPPPVSLAQSRTRYTLHSHSHSAVLSSSCRAMLARGATWRLVIRLPPLRL
jgi:hypothetical protein